CKRRLGNGVVCAAMGRRDERPAYRFDAINVARRFGRTAPKILSGLERLSERGIRLAGGGVELGGASNLRALAVIKIDKPVDGLKTGPFRPVGALPLQVCVDRFPKFAICRLLDRRL